jgi:hypothetical protein
MIMKPALKARGRTIGQQIHWPSAFQIHENGPVMLSLSPRPVIDAEDTHGSAI